MSIVRMDDANGQAPHGEVWATRLHAVAALLTALAGVIGAVTALLVILL